MSTEQRMVSLSASGFARTNPHVTLASADAAFGHDAEVTRWSELAGRTIGDCAVARTLGYAQLARAEALLASDPDGAQRAADSARLAFERVNAPLGLAAAYLALGAAQGRLGRPVESAESLERSKELYQRCAETVAADQARLTGMAAQSLAQSLATGLVVGDDATSIECLSPRETQVARLIAQGSSNQQIASLLDIKLNTVQVHVGRILRKLRVRSRTAVARLITLAEATEADTVDEGGN